MSEAIELHLRGMREDRLPIPEPTSLAEYVEASLSAQDRRRLRIFRA